MIPYAELEHRLRDLPRLIAQELAQDPDKVNEYLWLTRVVDHLLQWSDELGLRFERFQRTVSVTDSRSVKPAQIARSLSSLQRLIEQLARNTLLSDTERQARATLAEALSKLDQHFTRSGAGIPEFQPPSAEPQVKPRSAHDTGIINLLYGLDAYTPKPPPPLAEDSEPTVATPQPQVPRQVSAQEKMLQAMARALRQRQQPPPENKDKS